MILQEQKPKDQKSSPLGYIAVLVALLWVAAGIGAFIMSLVCFGRSGTTMEHVIGVLLAMFFGPFYWIYYFVAKSYCRKNVL